MEAKILNKRVVITGFRGVKVDVDRLFKEIRRRINGETHIQIFNAKFIAGYEHLYFAVLNALTAFKNGFNISKNLAMEVLLFASAQTQINKAIETLGVKPDVSEVAVVIISDSKDGAEVALRVVSELLSGERSDSVLELNEDKVKAIRELFSITDPEIEAVSERLGEGGVEEAVTRLIIERVALLPTQR